MPRIMFRRVPAVDVLLGIAGLFCAGISWMLVFTVPGEQRLAYVSVALLSTGVALLVFVRRIWVVPAFLGTYLLFAGIAVTAAMSSFYLSVQPILLFAPVSLMAVTEFARSWWWGPIGFLLGVAGSLGSPAIRADNFQWSVGTHIVVLTVAYLFAGHGRTIRSAHERELEAARMTERNRIAAELHDVLGHTLTVVRAQATAGLHIAERRHESTAGTLRTVAEVSKAALGDVRHLVGLLRDGHSDTASADTITDLRDTLVRARNAGVVVIDDLPPDETLSAWQQRWPTAARLAVLRVVREAVTNVIKHGGGEATVTVTVREDSGSCIVVVDNDGHVPRSLQRGNGLTGLQERMSSVGGTFDVAVTSSGVCLRAELPVPE
ncbi:histidine kinase [Nocardia sp. NPDC019395]|uniref:sensor histidine kinase n=1 Tax=Nocardia sp. NPDC019395 TaxID=3154686 RepID=UPI0033D30528